MNVTTSPPDTDQPDGDIDQEQDRSAPSAESVELAQRMGGTAVAAHSIVKVAVPADQWVEALTTARSEGYVFFSWLSAVDWANEVVVGDALQGETDERIEILCTVSDLGEGRMVTFSTTLDHDQPTIASLVGVFHGANWHEREAAEMFGIHFEGHPSLEPLYLPDGFLGNPLRKSFRLLSREVKPWPGKVDVEGMPNEGSDEDSDDAAQTDGPSTENPEA